MVELGLALLQPQGCRRRQRQLPEQGQGAGGTAQVRGAGSSGRQGWEGPGLRNGGWQGSGRGGERSVTVTVWRGLELDGWGGRLAGTSVGGHGLGPGRGCSPLTSDSSCSTTCRCQNPRSAGDTGVRETSTPDSPRPPSSLAQACSPLTQTPSPRERAPARHSPSARSTRQCPLRCHCPPGPPGARCGERGSVRAVLPHGPCPGEDTRRLGAWWPPGPLKGTSHPEEGSSDCCMGDRNLITLPLDSVPFLSLKSRHSQPEPEGLMSRPTERGVMTLRAGTPRSCRDAPASCNHLKISRHSEVS